MSKTVCFSGHRQIPDHVIPTLHTLLLQAVEKQIQDGATIFRAGGAVGFDTIAALTVLSLRRRYPHIRLELILPCPTQASSWSAEERGLYEQIIGQADSYRYVSQGYYKGVYQVRNRALIEGADTCIAYLRTSTGGTAFTVAGALAKGLQVINLGDLLDD